MKSLRSTAKLLTIFTLVVMTTVVIGCSRKTGGPDYPITSQEAIRRGEAPVNLLDKQTRGWIAADKGVFQQIEDGRLEVIVNLRNRSSKARSVLARTVFKDADGFDIGDATSWRVVHFAPQQILTYRAESHRPGAAYGTVEVRLP